MAFFFLFKKNCYYRGSYVTNWKRKKERVQVQWILLVPTGVRNPPGRFRHLLRSRREHGSGPRTPGRIQRSWFPRRVCFTRSSHGYPPGCSPAQNSIRTSLHLLVYLCLADLPLSLCDDAEGFRSVPFTSKSQVLIQICIGYVLSFAEKSPGSSCSSISFCCFALNVESNYSNCWFAFGIRFWHIYLCRKWSFFLLILGLFPDGSWVSKFPSREVSIRPFVWVNVLGSLHFVRGPMMFSV